MKYLLIFIFVCYSIGFAFAQTNKVNVSDLENNLKRLEKVSQELRNRTKVIQDSIQLIESQITNEKYASIYSNEYVCITKSNAPARLRDNPSAGGNEISIIPKNKNIKVLEYVGDGYWKVGYNTLNGFVNEVFLNLTEEMTITIKKFNENIKISDKKRKEEVKQFTLTELETNFGKENVWKISSHKIWMGMTDDMASASIGSPKSINKSVGSWGIHEQWVYEKRFLYFENGKLTSWQEN